MYYILLQLKTTKQNPKGDVWSTSLTPKLWKTCPGDSLEKFLEREKIEVMKTCSTYEEVRKTMIKWHNYCLRNSGDSGIDLARKFFKK